MNGDENGEGNKGEYREIGIEEKNPGGQGRDEYFSIRGGWVYWDKSNN